VLSASRPPQPKRIPPAIGSGNLFFRVLECRNVQRGADKSANPAPVVRTGKSPYPYQACFTIRDNDPEPLVIVSGSRGFFKLQEYLAAVIRMDDPSYESGSLLSSSRDRPVIVS